MPRRVTAVLLHNSRAVGGVEVSLAGWMKYFDRARIQPLLYCFEEADAAELGFIAYTRARGIPVSILPWGKRKRYPAAVAELVRVLRANRPAVLHVNDMRPEAVGIPAARIAGCAVISSNHGWHSIWEGIGLKRRRNDVLRAFLASRCDLNIAVAEFVRQESIDRGVAARRIITLHTGVDEDELSAPPDRETARDRLGYKPEDFVIGNFARLYPEKAQDLLIAAFARIANQFPQVRLLIAGDGPLAQALRSQVDRLGLKSKVLMVPFQDDIAALYAAIDLFALPSHAEGAALVLYKAIVMGVPVVASHVAAAPEIVRDGVDGFLVAPGDEEALSSAFRKALTLGTNRMRQMGVAGRERARPDGRFSIRRSAEALEEIYERFAR